MDWSRNISEPIRGSEGGREGRTVATAAPIIQNSQSTVRTTISPRNVVKKRNSRRLKIATMLFKSIQGYHYPLLEVRYWDDLPKNAPDKRDECCK